MSRLLLLIALFIPALTMAECGVARGEDVINIVVSTKGGNCFAHEGFRDTFLNHLSRELDTQDAGRQPRNRTATQRRPQAAPTRQTSAPGQR